MSDVTDGAVDQYPSLAQEEKRFSAVLTPHRSLSPKGFVILMTAVGVVSFTAGFAFVLMGAWPVVGFFGLDVLLIYVAFRLNYRSGRLYETVDLTKDALTIRRVRPSGRVESWSFNPYWVRLTVARRPGQTAQLALSSHGDTLVFGVFLTDGEKEDFADALQSALLECRGGVRI